MFDNNFGKCGPIFKILSPIELINTKNLKSFIIVKAHCSMTHLKQQKSLGFF